MLEIICTSDPTSLVHPPRNGSTDLAAQFQAQLKALSATYARERDLLKDVQPHMAFRDVAVFRKVI